jgi:2-dehydro-3-deoxyphosphogluconate aldolase/(4S)-4-hydroxy-2-oxoglutarate aldolase
LTADGWPDDCSYTLAGETVKITDTIQRLVRDGFILVFNQDKLDVVKTAHALMDAGIYNMEVTCRISKPLEKIRTLKKELPDFCVGAASLVDFPPFLKTYNRQHSDDPLPSPAQAVEAGVDYLVSAVNFSDDTFKKYAGKVVIIPGCATATEIVEQYSRGANFCKLFPAKQIGGPSYIKAVDPAVHKLISIIPTGGTAAENIPDYISAGVLIVGGSFSMIAKDTFRKIIDEQDYQLLYLELKKIKTLIDQCRAKQYPSLDFESAALAQLCDATGRNFNIPAI